MGSLEVGSRHPYRRPVWIPIARGPSSLRLGSLILRASLVGRGSQHEHGPVRLRQPCNRNLCNQASSLFGSGKPVFRARGALAGSLCGTAKPPRSSGRFCVRRPYKPLGLRALVVGPSRLRSLKVCGFRV